MSLNANTLQGDDTGSPSLDGEINPLLVLDLDRALQKLEQLDPDLVRIVEMRFFRGLTVEETAAALGIAPATVKREWILAKGWLHRELTSGDVISQPF